MKKKSILLLCMLPLVWSSCSKDPQLTADKEIIFGHFYGECGGPKCVLNYKLGKSGLQQDIKKDYSGSGFSFVNMDAKHFKLAEKLWNYPPQLDTLAEGTLGCPDCVDQGGVLLIIRTAGKSKKWRIDVNNAEVPVYLNDYALQIKSVIADLNP